MRQATIVKYTSDNGQPFVFEYDGKTLGPYFVRIGTYGHLHPDGKINIFAIYHRENGSESIGWYSSEEEARSIAEQHGYTDCKYEEN